MYLVLIFGLLFDVLKMAHHLVVIRIAAEISSPVRSATYKGELQNINNSQEQAFGLAKALSRDSHGIHTSTTHSATGKHLDVEELEMLLEAYFVQIDGTLNKLSTVWNYIYELSFFFFLIHDVCFSNCR